MLPKGGEVAMESARAAARYRIESTGRSSPASAVDMPGWVRFARQAEESGIDSVLISFSRYEPDPLLVACALGRETERLKYIVAFRSGLHQPGAFVQMVNTLSQLIGGRVSLNLVAGSSREEQHGYGDFLAHDERYEPPRSSWPFAGLSGGAGTGPMSLSSANITGSKGGTSSRPSAPRTGPRPRSMSRGIPTRPGGSPATTAPAGCA